ncbi:Hsp20/alpha crystallin family protein [Staphylococcus canis]|uniref:Hsp20/alpha crystallin family protein n=1 Tax=Staphylococcus canis TaxID=2724942 RepID=A0ABS0TAH6_9STAP|nr:Hsp20/alpha crystallin family protein [Staphylococcus canis]MBI5975745.1 Hsp20/alpha crystallin family protein [Staphylococcus canis]
MAFQMKPFNNSFFNVNTNDIFKALDQSLFNTQSMMTDIKELDDKYVVEAALPGMNKEDIKIDFDRNLLTIEANQQTENNQDDENGQWIHRERQTSYMKRQFSFNNIDRDNIKAAYTNGMLNVTLPKRQADEDTSSNIEIE